MEYDIATVMNLILLEKPIFLPPIYVIGVREEKSKDYLVFNATYVSRRAIQTFQVDLDLLNESWSVRSLKGLSR